MNFVSATPTDLVRAGLPRWLRKLHDEYSAGSKKGQIVHSRILGSRIRLDIKMQESADMVEVDITSAKFKDIKEKNLKFVYLNFTSVHSYSQEDGSFCDYYI